MLDFHECSCIFKKNTAPIHTEILGLPLYQNPGETGLVTRFHVTVKDESPCLISIQRPRTLNIIFKSHSFVLKLIRNVSCEMVHGEYLYTNKSKAGMWKRFAQTPI